MMASGFLELRQFVLMLVTGLRQVRILVDEIVIDQPFDKPSMGKAVGPRDIFERVILRGRNGAILMFLRFIIYSFCCQADCLQS